MKTTIDEIAPDIYRLSTFLPDVTPAGFTFNQCLVVAGQPLLFHTGPRGLFPLVAEAVASVIPVESLRLVSFGHVESDECGSMNMWLAAAPRSKILFNALGCDISLNDMSDRPPHSVDDGSVLDLGGKIVEVLATPHVPHGWEAQVLFERSTGTLFCGDLFTHVGPSKALVDSDIVGPALEAESMFHATALTPSTAATLRRLGDLNPRTLAVMHGASFEGNGRAALYELAGGYERMMAAAQPAAAQ